MEPLHVALRRSITTEAVAAGHDPTQAGMAWDACVRYIASHPATFAPVVGESNEQHRERRLTIRQQRSELRRVAGFALGATLLAILVNWALGRLINWIVDSVLVDASTRAVSTWEGAYPPWYSTVNGLVSVPVRLSWKGRITLWVFDVVLCLHRYR